ncbi:hypothetical protein [Mesorhizobium australafricanum]|uniref:Uncharacterized protein n=1 Tax=Mesorhizobium australafricanum TaxID=3072311 RepID=A0ABU4X0P2_9HYPH|nr:hypothetical protein [Mesorhizobium sp. VK3E]MDX8441872.1 hypothetical protein [Mesorhizobium sp. VK3E]
MTLGRALCVSMLVAAIPGSAAGIDLVSVRPVDDESEPAGNSGSYYHCGAGVLPQ